MAVIRLLDKVSTDTVGGIFPGDGKDKVLNITATSLGGGTISVELSDTTGTLWAPAMYKDDVPFEVTTIGAYKLEKMPAGIYIRASLSGSTGANNVSVELS
jgi:hypothetical protein